MAIASPLLEHLFALIFDHYQRSVDGQKPIPIQHAEAIIGTFFERLAESN